jgi:hypothetical protein
VHEIVVSRASLAVSLHSSTRVVDDNQCPTVNTHGTEVTAREGSQTSAIMGDVVDIDDFDSEIEDARWSGETILDVERLASGYAATRHICIAHRHYGLLGSHASKKATAVNDKNAKLFNHPSHDLFFTHQAGDNV